MIKNKLMQLYSDEVIILEELRKEFKEFRNEVTGKLEQVDNRFEQVDNRFEQVDNRFEQVDNRLKNVEAISIDNRETLKEIRPVITQMAENINLLTSHIDAFLKKSESNEQEITVIRYRQSEDFQNHEDRITALEEKLA